MSRRLFPFFGRDRAALRPEKSASRQGGKGFLKSGRGSGLLRTRRNQSGCHACTAPGASMGTTDRHPISILPVIREKFGHSVSRSPRACLPRKAGASMAPKFRSSSRVANKANALQVGAIATSQDRVAATIQPVHRRAVQKDGPCRKSPEGLSGKASGHSRVIANPDPRRSRCHSARRKTWW